MVKVDREMNQARKVHTTGTMIITRFTQNVQRFIGNSTENSISRDVNSYPDSQEIRNNLWNPKVSFPVGPKRYTSSQATSGQDPRASLV